MRRNWQEVVLDLNAALQLSPRRADLLVLRASARRALKNYRDALADTEAALKLSPGSSLLFHFHAYRDNRTVTQESVRDLATYSRSALMLTILAKR